MNKNTLIYPVIVTECNDETGHYFSVVSPNIKGMVTDGATLSEAMVHAEDAIATMIADTKYPKVQDPRKWNLEKDDFIMWVPVNMDKWLDQNQKTVRRNISIPEGLNNWAKKNKINVSKVATDALRKMQES